MIMRNTIKQFINQQTPLMVAVLVIVAALFAINLTMRPSTPTPGVTVEANTAPQVAKMDKVTITPQKVKALPQRAKAKLVLPEPVVSDPSMYALTASRIEPDLHPVTVTPVIDTDTGEVRVYEKTEPLPWLSITQRGEAGIAYGLKDGQPNARLFFRQGLFDVKALRIGIEATADQDGETFVGASLAWRW